LKKFLIIVVLLTGYQAIQPLFGQLNKAYFFYKGEELLSQQKYTQALPYLNTLISIDSSLYEGWFLRGVAKYNLGDIQGAISDFDRVIKVKPFFADAHHYKAIALTQLSQYKLAMHEITIAIDLKPNASDFLFTLGVAHYHLKEFQKAIEVFSKVIRLDNSNPDVWLNRGSARLITGDTIGALSDYNMAIRVSPFYANAYSRRGILNAEINKPNLALADLTKAISLDTLSIDNYFNRALILYNQKQPTKALADLNRVLEIDPNYSLALFNRAIINYQISNWEKSIDDLTRLTSLNPENVLIYYYRGSIYYEKGQLQRAINDYSTAINIFPDFANAYINRADVKLKLGDISGSEIDYKKGVEIQNKYRNSQSQNPLSMIDSSGKFSRLISLERDFNTASRLSLEINRFKISSAFLPMLKLCLNNPSANQKSRIKNTPWLDSINQHLPSAYKLILSTEPDNYTKQISVFTIDSALSSNPYYSLVKGIVLSSNGKFAQANEEFTKATDKHPQNPLIRLSKIISNTDMARYIESFGGEIKPLGIRQSETKNETSIIAYSEAIEELTVMSENIPDSPYITYNIANINILANNFSEAITWYGKTISADPAFASAYYNRGLALLLSGSKNQGCIDLSTAGEMGISQSYEALQRFCGN